MFAVCPIHDPPDAGQLTDHKELSNSTGYGGCLDVLMVYPQVLLDAHSSTRPHRWQVWLEGAVGGYWW